MVTPDSPRQLHVLGHDSYPFPMDGTQVTILKERDQVRLRCLLQREDSSCLPPVGISRHAELDLAD